MSAGLLRVVGVLLFAAFLGGMSRYPASAADPADAWVTNAPANPSITREASTLFEGLVASEDGRRLLVSWSPSIDPGAFEQVSVQASTGAPGHWPSRDWRTWPMTRSGDAWQARIPVVSVDAPVIYQVRAAGRGTTWTSPMRAFHPAVAGMVWPTHPFNGYVEGFEDGITAWEPTVADRSERAVAVSTNSLSGRGALRMEVPAGRGSMTVGTTRIQAWMFNEHSPLAVRFAARTEGGSGRVGCALHGNTGTPQLAVYPAVGTFEVGPEWQRLEAPLPAFASLRPGTVDAFTIQFFAESGRALLVDDLELVLR